MLLAAAPAAAQSPLDSLVAFDRTAQFTGVLADDAVYLHPGAPVLTGAAAIRAFLAAQPEQPGVRRRAFEGWISADGTVGATWGALVVMRNVSDTVAVRIAMEGGRFIAVWRRQGGQWRLAAFVGVQVLVPADSASIRRVRRSLPPLPARGAAAPFITADLQFSALAGRSGAETAFRQFAADDAVMFGRRLVDARGPREIGALFAGDSATWRWHPVAAGASRDGSMGWTVGEADITGRAANGAPQTFYSKYLTVWRRDARGVRFLVDGGNTRPQP